jgi:hypothetical protein
LVYTAVYGIARAVKQSVYTKVTFWAQISYQGLRLPVKNIVLKGRSAKKYLYHKGAIRVKVDHPACNLFWDC